MRFPPKIFLIVLIGYLSQVLLLAQARTTPATAIDVKATYRLSNDFSGTSKFLTVNDDETGLVMADATRSPKQLWLFSPLGEGRFKIASLSNEENMLDVNKNGDGYLVVVRELGEYSGQMWRFVTQKDGKFRFLNAFAGDERSLDVHKNGSEFSVVMSDNGNYSGQAWTLTKVTQR
jgi:hypothetical protein